ncbi:hypothetical protein JCM19037_2066 [Geomicrobium sp. JCM 19037]|nr:hypothetical protein JCM19037_2066 [Geomicrobium sp. JCM 19037]
MNAIYQNIQALTTNNPKIIYFTSPTSSKKQALVGMTLAKTLAKNKAKVLYYNVYAKTSFVDRYLPKSSNVMSEKSHQIHRTLHRGVDRLQIKTSAHGLHSFESLVKEWKEFYAYIFIDAYGPFQNEWHKRCLSRAMKLFFMPNI